MHPLQDGITVLKRARMADLRGQPIVNGNNNTIKVAGKAAIALIVHLRHPDDVTPAVDVEKRRQRPRRTPGV